MVPLTKSIINDRLRSTGFELVDEYVNNRTPVIFKCSFGHEFLSRPINLLNRLKCSVCSEITFEKINERLQPRGIKLIEPYNGYGVNNIFIGNCGHSWEATPKNVLRKTGCPICAHKNNRIIKDIVNERIKSRGYELIGHYEYALKKTTFKCNNDHEWEARPANIMDGRGCPYCATYGFNNLKPAWCYVLNFNIFIKYGITNDLEGRLATHRVKNGDFKIAHTHFVESGDKAVIWENKIKSIFGGNYANRDQCPQGFTETLSPSLLQDIINTLKE